MKTCKVVGLGPLRIQQESQLDALTGDGWELITVIAQGPCAYAYLTRAVPEVIVIAAPQITLQEQTVPIPEPKAPETLVETTLETPAPKTVRSGLREIPEPSLPEAPKLDDAEPKDLGRKGKNGSQGKKP